MLHGRLRRAVQTKSLRKCGGTSIDKAGTIKQGKAPLMRGFFIFQSIRLLLQSSTKRGQVWQGRCFCFAIDRGAGSLNARNDDRTTGCCVQVKGCGLKVQQVSTILEGVRGEYKLCNRRMMPGVVWVVPISVMGR